MSVVIRNVRILSPNSSLHQATEIGIEKGLFVDPTTIKDAQVVDGQGGLLIPGLIDCRVNLREPGLEHKGTIASETLSLIHI